MALSDFRDTFAWTEAVELGPELVQLAEQLPASEEMGLAYRLRKAMIDLPAAIAEDLMEGDSYTRRVQIARIAAALDIIDKVYPALDTAGVRTKLEKLADRVAGDRFGEPTPGAKQVYLPGAKVHAGPADPPPPPPQSAPPKRAPSSVPVVPEPRPADHDRDDHNHDHGDHNHDHAAATDEPSAPALKVPVTPEGPDPAPTGPDLKEDHVHPDSVQ